MPSATTDINGTTVADATVVKDTSDRVTLRCEHGLEYTRSNNLGMFCDRVDCECERLSRDVAMRLLPSTDISNHEQSEISRHG